LQVISTEFEVSSAKEPVKTGVRPGSGFTSSLAAIMGGQVATGIIALLTEIIYARVLGPAARGTISLCVMSIAFGNLVGGIGGEGTIIYWASRHRNESAWLPGILLCGSAGCIGAVGCWYAALNYFHLQALRGLDQASGVAVAISIPAAVLFAYAMAIASGTESFGVRSICALARQIVGIISFVALLFLLGHTATAALWGNFLGLMFGSLLTVVLLWSWIRGFSHISGGLKHFVPSLAFGLRGQFGNLATFFNYRLDVFIVNYFLDPAQLGFYALGVAISEALWQVPSAVASALFPRTGRSSEAEATQFTCFILRQVALISVVCGAAIALASPFAIPLIFGARFKSSIAVVWWILPGTIALSMGKVACADLAGRGKNGYSSIAAFICLGFTAVLDWLLIPKMGILGAALASSIAYFLDSLLILIALRHELNVPWRKLVFPVREDMQGYRSAFERVYKQTSRLLSSRLSPPKAALTVGDVE
jgi:O-antigen/teichoic acid export membrane protein